MSIELKMQEITHEQLEPGTSYYIESLIMDKNKNMSCNYKRMGRFTGYKNEMYSNEYKLACFTNFRKPNDDIFDGYDVQLHRCWHKYFEVKKYKIQQNMETKASNIMLSRIIGDPYFDYTL